MGADHPAAILDWAEITRLTDQLAQEIRSDGLPDVLVGVLRGGMIPAIRLAHVLGLRDVRALDVTHTNADGVNAAKTPSPVSRNPASAGDVTGLDVLLVDDVAGTGETIAATRLLLYTAGAAKVRSAVGMLNEVNWRRSGNGDPADFLTYVGATCDGWVVFPWEIH